jgi:threonine aldolase
MAWFDLEDAGVSDDEFIELGRERGLKLGGGRLVVHYQISEEAVGRLEDVMKVALARKGMPGGEREEKVGFKAYG